MDDLAIRRSVFQKEIVDLAIFFFARQYYGRFESLAYGGYLGGLVTAGLVFRQIFAGVDDLKPRFQIIDLARRSQRKISVGREEARYLDAEAFHGLQFRKIEILFGLHDVLVFSGNGGSTLWLGDALQRRIFGVYCIVP